MSDATSDTGGRNFGCEMSDTARPGAGPCRQPIYISMTHVAKGFLEILVSRKETLRRSLDYYCMCLTVIVYNK